MTDVFLIEDNAYYLRTDGKLYLCSENGDTLIHTFPTYIISWSESMNGFIFLDKRDLYVYHLDEDSTIHYCKVDVPIKRKDLSYVLFSSEKDIYFKCGHSKYSLDIKSHEIEEIDLPIDNCFRQADSLYIVFASLDYHSIYTLNLETNAEREIVREKADKPVTSACILGDTLYYVRSDGKIRYCNLDGNSQNMPQKGTELKTEYNVTAVSASGENLLCVIAESQGDVRFTGLVEILPDGTVRMIQDFDEPAYMVPGSCSLESDETRYIWAVSTEKTVRQGSLN